LPQASAHVSALRPAARAAAQLGVNRDGRLPMALNLI
jgi:hypothetical protein